MPTELPPPPKPLPTPARHAMLAKRVFLAIPYSRVHPPSIGAPRPAQILRTRVASAHQRGERARRHSTSGTCPLAKRSGAFSGGFGGSPLSPDESSGIEMLLVGHLIPSNTMALPPIAFATSLNSASRPRRYGSVANLLLAVMETRGAARIANCSASEGLRL